MAVAKDRQDMLGSEPLGQAPVITTESLPNLRLNGPYATTLLGRLITASMEILMPRRLLDSGVNRRCFCLHAVFGSSHPNATRRTPGLCVFSRTCTVQLRDCGLLKHSQATPFQGVRLVPFVAAGGREPERRPSQAALGVTRNIKCHEMSRGTPRMSCTVSYSNGLRNVCRFSETTGWILPAQEL